MSVPSFTESLCYEKDLNSQRDKIINELRKGESSSYKNLQLSNAIFKLLDAIDNHYPDSHEFALLYCEAKELRDSVTL